MAYLVASLCLVSFLALFAAYGSCDSMGQNCLPGWQRLLIFPGSLVVAMIGGILLVRLFTRDPK